MFLQSIHSLRGVLICFILIDHCRYLVGDPLNNSIEKIALAVYSNTTTLFILLSGFLYAHAVANKNNNLVFSSFIRKKMDNVFIPFFLLSVVPMIAVLWMGGRWRLFDFVPEVARDNNILYFFWLLINGKPLVPYWFVSALFSIFLTLPVLNRVIVFERRRVSIFVLLLLPFLVFRPVENLGIVQNYLYFMPLFLFGALLYWDYQKILCFVSKYLYVLLFVATLLVAYLSFVSDYPGKHGGVFLEWNGVDINLLLKLDLFVLALYFFENILVLKNSRIFSYLGGISFNIYLVHAVVLSIFDKLFGQQLHAGLIGQLGVFAVLLGITVLIIKSIKFLLGGYASYFIGK